MATEFEITARWRKAIIIASRLYVSGIKADEIGQISEAQWKQLAARLDQNEPKAKTIEVIGEILRVLEAAVAQKIQEEKAKS